MLQSSLVPGAFSLCGARARHTWPPVCLVLLDFPATSSLPKYLTLHTYARHSPALTVSGGPEKDAAGQDFEKPGDRGIFGADQAAGSKGPVWRAQVWSRGGASCAGAGAARGRQEPHGHARPDQPVLLARAARLWRRLSAAHRLARHGQGEPSAPRRATDRPCATRARPSRAEQEWPAGQPAGDRAGLRAAAQRLGRRRSRPGRRALRQAVRRPSGGSVVSFGSRRHHPPPFASRWSTRAAPSLHWWPTTRATRTRPRTRSTRSTCSRWARALAGRLAQ